MGGVWFNLGKVIHGRGLYASNSIFLPASGGDGAKLTGVGYGRYFSSTLLDDNGTAEACYFDSDGYYYYLNISRDSHCFVRPVKDVD